MSKGFDIPHNKHLGNSHDYWKAPQKNSKQIVYQPMQWIKIDRNENGFATEKCLDKMFNNLPCVVAINSYGMDIYKVIPEWDKQTRDFLKSKAIYTHYLPIPKLEV